ncbi:low phytic acid3 [Zea mays]|uniref:Low phytic acid3 n=1 Tax=Zea mays TaxID=4577 RepID=A0A1D6L398_MAIZE|nr:low phytic acid3 [Zea mays]
MPRRPNHLAPCTLCCLLPACCHCISHLPLSAWMTIGVAEHGLWMCIRVHLVKLRAMKKLLLYKLDYGGMEDARPGHQEACSHLPKISSKETHPKIAQVLLERQKYDMALLVLKCTGHGSFSATENFKKDDISSLSEAVTVVRVRIECRLLTEAFMYHRSYCSKVKEQHSADMTHAEDALKNSWVYHVEMMVTEFCAICIKRNLVDKMIDLPWDSEEEKHLHKSLFDSAHEMPMKPNGSLLVVYYLRRYRYLEAYEVDRSLQKFEQKILENTTEEIASKIRAIARWRESLVVKCLDMLPEVQRENVKAINSGEQSQFARTAQLSSPAHVGKSQSPVMDLSTTFTTSLQNKSSLLRKNNALTDSGGLIRSSRSEFGRKVPSVLDTRASPHGPPTSNMRSSAGDMFPTVGQRVESPFLRGAKDISSRKGEEGFKKGIKYGDHDPVPMYLNLSSGDTPMKDYRTSLLKTAVNKTTIFQGKDSVGKGELHFGSRAEKPFILNGTGVGQNGLAKVSGYAGFREDYKVPTKENILR